ncbi:MAG: nucleotidyltransferase family protein [Pseudomonadota bacterium]
MKVLDLSAQAPEVRLQILAAKTVLSPEEQARFQDLLQRITEWTSLGQSATRNFSLPLLRKHIKSHSNQDHIPRAFYGKLDEGANRIALRNLMHLQCQKTFNSEVLEAASIPGVWFKGVTMATQYYPDVGLRPCRDLDVIVPKGALEGVLKRALDSGYRLVSPDRLMKDLSSPRDLRALLRYGDSATLVAQEKFVIDLQERLDKHSGIFDRFNVFKNAPTVRAGGTDFLTMPPAFLLNYLCHHHTRHTWSRLHWLSDLDAMVAHPDFDVEEVLSMADDLGQRGTVEASLELNALMSVDESWDEPSTWPRGKAFMSMAVQNLPGKMDIEKQLQLNLIGGEFLFDWQARPEIIAKARRAWWRDIFKPTISQYGRFPLPEVLQWIYYIPRFWELTHQTITRKYQAWKA